MNVTNDQLMSIKDQTTNTVKSNHDQHFSQTYLSRGYPGTTCQAHVTLTLGLPEQMFQMTHLLMMENNCAYLY